MKVTKQTTANECGICVINSLLEHYFHIDDKYALINHVQGAYPYGLNIEQFEQLCIQNHLIPYSYQLTFDEFKSLKTNGKYFVLLISKNKLNHYVIAKKTKEAITIYDSEDGIYQITYENLSKCFLGIYIKIEKQKYPIKPIKSKHIWSIINMQCLLINVLIELLIGGLSIGFSYFFNLVLSLCTSVLIVKNLVLICFIFLLISALKNITGYLYGLYINKIILQNYQVIHIDVINNLMHKSIDFLDKVNPQNIYLLNMAIIHILNFNINQISGFIANLLVSLICLVMCCIYSWIFIVLMALIVLVEVIFYFLSINKINYLVQTYIKSENDVNRVCTTYLSEQKNLLNYENFKSLKNDLHYSFLKNTKIEANQDILKQGYGSIKSFLGDLFFIVAVFLGMILLDKKQIVNVGSLLFLTALINLFMNNISGLMGIGYAYQMYLKMLNIYQEFTKVENIDYKGKLAIKEIESLSYTYQKRTIHIKNGRICRIDHHKLANIVLNRVKNSPYGIMINNRSSKEFDLNTLIKMTYYVDNQHSYFRQLDYDTLSNHPEIKLTLQKLEVLKKDHQVSQLLHNLVFHMKYHHRLIIVDENWRHLPKTERNFLTKNVFPIIKENNFLVI